MALYALGDLHLSLSLIHICKYIPRGKNCL